MNTGVIALLIGLAGGGIPAWWLTADHYQGVIAKNEVKRQKEIIRQQKEIIEQQEETRLGLLAYANRIVTAGEQLEKNTIIVRNLRRERERMRIDFPVCPVPAATGTGADSDGGARVFSDAVDALFARLQSRTGELVEECDTLNNAAIRRNAERKPPASR